MQLKNQHQSTQGLVANYDCEKRCKLARSDECEKHCPKFEPAKQRCRALKSWRDRYECLLFTDWQSIGLIEENHYLKSRKLKSPPKKRNAGDVCAPSRGQFLCWEATCTQKCVRQAMKNPELTEGCIEAAAW
jgi:hypothetical protein